MLYSFCVLCSYYVLRPLREAIGASDADMLDRLWTGTFLAMLIAAPIYSAVASRFSRRRFIPIVYRFFALNMLLFYAAVLVLPRPQHVWIERTFYVWLSVFNLFAITSFWAFMADVWRNEQAKRLFGLIAVGGTLGAILGSVAATQLPRLASAFLLLLLAAALLETAVWCMRALDRTALQHDQQPVDALQSSTARIGGNVITGIAVVFRSPYLLAICAYLLIYTAMSTVLYFEQSHIVRAAIDTRADRTQLFATINLIVNTLTLITQAFLTGRIIRAIGIGLTLTLVPLLCVVGFLALAIVQRSPNPGDQSIAGISTLLLVLVVFQVLRRAGNYALGKPAREVLFTLVTREQKYKSKAFIDTVVYRGGDVTFAWAFSGLQAVGMGLGAIALTAAPLAGVWVGIGLLLGHLHGRRAADESEFDPPPADADAVDGFVPAAEHERGQK